ncbi:hypothetical protein Z945_1464 [Sulfitobacter noctilucae]|uniref:hypothetical protein n=1 Tax=Sulfitobacter noctilucae TaxID=1342302 RepID=UPI000468669E|nr:hypothetical protein [Sulfitobacter noctilucae]KIN60491.1 hypothetical protein Z945_1464 [Sulfitobacter noctilucae]
MRALAFALLCGWAAFAGPAQAQKIYEGSEAAALRCANTLALTAVALARAELIPQNEKEVMLGITILMLERHVSGTRSQKKRALELMRDRRSVDDTIADYRRNATQCLRQFPIN